MQENAAPTLQQTSNLSSSSPNSYTNPQTSSFDNLKPPPTTTPEPTPPIQEPAKPITPITPAPTATPSTPSTYEDGWAVPTVEDELNKITGSDSTTMQQARNQGLRTAGSRGLLNSSIAAQSAEQAAIEVAAPIAQQNVTNQLQQQQFAQSVTANTQGQYMTSTNDIINQALISINEIETSSDIAQAEKDKMIANTIQRRDSDLEFMKEYYSAMPTWSGSWVNFPTMPSAPGVTT